MTFLSTICLTCNPGPTNYWYKIACSMTIELEFTIVELLAIGHAIYLWPSSYFGAISFNSRWGGWTAETWSSLVEGDEQADRPQSQTSMECCRACVAAYFWGVVINTTAYHLGRYSIHLLLLKSSMILPVKFVNFTAWFSLPIKSLQRLGILKSGFYKHF